MKATSPINARHWRTLWVRQILAKRGGEYSTSKCMEEGCKKPPEVECIWAEGRGRAWHCQKHHDAWVKNDGDGDLPLAIVKQRKVPNGVVGEKYGEYPKTGVLITASWLTRILNRIRGIPLSAQDQRDFVEKGYESLKKDLIRVVRASIPAIQKAERDAAIKNGIDPLFLNWFVVNGKNWPPMGKEQRDALRAIQSVYLWFGAVPSHWQNMVVPDVDRMISRDAAIIDFADVLVRVIIPRIAKTHVQAVWKKAKDLAVDLDIPTSAMPEFGMSVLKDFEYRLVADRFQTQSPIQQIVDLMG